MEIDNHLGTALNPGDYDYSALWTQISGPGTVAFAPANAASTTMTFPVYGTCRVQLSATRNGYTLIEPIDLVVSQPGSGTTPQPPVIASHPAGLSVNTGDQVVFNVTATGDGPFLYQWRRNGVSHWPASNTGSLTLARASVRSAGDYDCVITNPAGYVLKSFRLIQAQPLGTRGFLRIHVAQP